MKPKIKRVNWHYFVCRQCKGYGDAHMVSMQASMELCDECFRKSTRAETRGGAEMRLTITMDVETLKEAEELVAKFRKEYNGFSFGVKKQIARAPSHEGE